MPDWLDVDLLQTIALLVSVCVSLVALGWTVSESSLGQRRRRLERVLDAVLELNDMAILTSGTLGHEPELKALQAKLAALIQMADVPPSELHQCHLLTRGTGAHRKIPEQTEAALLELADAFRKVDRRWPRRLRPASAGTGSGPQAHS